LPCMILGTDAEPTMLDRAREGCYAPGSLRDLPGDLREAFLPVDGRLCLAAARRAQVDFKLQDVRRQMPSGSFDMIMCRNIVLTYFPTGFYTAYEWIRQTMASQKADYFTAHDPDAWTWVLRTLDTLEKMQARPLDGAVFHPGEYFFASTQSQSGSRPCF